MSAAMLGGVLQHWALRSIVLVCGATCKPARPLDVPTVRARRKSGAITQGRHEGVGVKGPVGNEGAVDEGDRDVVAPAGAQVLIGVDVDDRRLRHEIAVILSHLCNEFDDLIAQMTPLAGDNNDAPLDRRVEGP